MLLLTLLMACAPQPAPLMPAPVSPSLPPPSASPAPTNSPSPAPIASPTPSPTPAPLRFPLQRPIPGAIVERSYPYGSTQNGAREAHHGVEFYQPFGTPVLAAADGKVAFAGDDALTLLAWVTNFYGNVIVLQHQIAGQTLFTLYAHLSKIEVQAGQQISVGQKIGEVGASGTAIGSHLHFEVRLGKNDYFSTRNPELWLNPLDGNGTLAGRILDSAGNALKGQINFQRVEGGVLNPLSVGQAQTYVRERLNSDDLLGETFALGDLPAGEYRLSLVANGVVYEKIVLILPGELAWAEFVVQ
ncbi:MAG: hypothetical protein OHK0031_19730 [Anaerolineales bacterium]